jgi:hypothetical protein
MTRSSFADMFPLITIDCPILIHPSAPDDANRIPAEMAVHAHEHEGFR